MAPTPDAGAPDAGRLDAGAPDAGSADAGAADAGAADAGTPDAGAADAGTPDAGPPDAGSPDAGPFSGACRADGWCWNAPFPQGNNLTAAWVTTPTDVWFAGWNVLLHFDGSTFAHAAAPPSVYRALWASSPTDVWAVGSGATIVRWNGSQWARQAPPSTSEQFTSIWGFSPNDVWVGGNALHHWNGATWTSYSTNAPVGAVTDIHGTSPSNVYFVGGYDSFSHWNGSMLVALEYAIFGGLTYGVETVWAADPDRPTLGAYRFLTWDGGYTGSRVAGSSVRELWGSASAGLWAAGDQGFVWSRGSAGWDAAIVSPAGLEGLSGSGPRDLWAVGNGGEALHFDGTSWTSALRPSPLRNSRAIYAASPDEVWASTFDGALGRWNGSRWTMYADAGFGGARINAFAGVPGDVWGVGTGGLIVRSDGGAVSVVPFIATGDASRIARAAANDVWVVASPLPNRSPALYHWDGVSWTSIAMPGGEYGAFDVAVYGGEVFVVGSSDVFKRNGSAWQRTDAGFTHSLSVLPPNELWSGYPGWLSRYVDGGWERHPIALQYRLSAVSRLCGRPPKLWVFDGFYNALWGTDAGTVVPVENPISNIADCTTASDGTVWISSYSGAVLWRRD